MYYQNYPAYAYAGYEVTGADLQAFGLDQRVRTIGDVHGQRLPGLRQFMHDYQNTVPGAGSNIAGTTMIGAGLGMIPTAIFMSHDTPRSSSASILLGSSLMALLGGVMGYAISASQHQAKVMRAFSNVVDHVATDADAREKLSKTQSYRELIAEQRASGGIQLG